MWFLLVAFVIIVVLTLSGVIKHLDHYIVTPSCRSGLPK